MDGKIYFRVDCWGVCILCDGKPIGSIGMGFKCSRLDSNAVGYSLDMRFRQRGIMSRALKVYLEYYPHDTVHAVVKPENTASIRLLQKSGFVQVEMIDYPYLVFEYSKTGTSRKVA